MRQVRIQHYAIYYNPSDVPGKYVVRRWWIDVGSLTPDPDRHVVDTLEEARKLIPDGFTCVPRYMNDDPVIVEVWV